MKLQVRSSDTTIFYPLASWSWNARSHELIQRIPKITEVRFHIPGSTKTPSIQVPEREMSPSLQIGQEVRMGEEVWYIAHIEVVPPFGQFTGITYVYTLTGLAPVIPAFWTVDVEEEVDNEQIS